MAARVRPRAAGAGRILVIHNPTAGWRRPHLLDQVVALLLHAERQVTVVPTLQAGHATQLAAAAGGDAFGLVVAAGGDGTINEVLNGLHGSGVPLAICPMGTANVLAREISLQCNAAAVADCILGERILPVALGEARRPDGGSRLFVQMLGAGFDAQVVAGVSRPLKRRLGRWAYVAVSGREAFRYRYPRFRLSIDGAAHTATSVIIANGRHYGGAFVAAPNADLRRDSFQVCLFDRGGALNVGRYGIALLGGFLHRLPDLAILTARRVEIEGPTGAPLQGDGDLFGSLPVSVRIAALRQNLVVPEAAFPDLLTGQA